MVNMIFPNLAFNIFTRVSKTISSKYLLKYSLHKQKSFPLKISSVNVTKSFMENFFCAVIY